MNELIKRRRRLTELEVQNFLLQIISGLKYLHQNKVIHRESFYFSFQDSEFSLKQSQAGKFLPHRAHGA